MSAPRWFVGLVCLALAVPVAAVTERKGGIDARTMELARVSSRSVDVSATTPSKAGGAVLEFGEYLPGTWRFRMDPRTERFTMIKGSGIPLIPGRGNDLQAKSFGNLKNAEGRIDVQAIEPLVREFVERHRTRIGPPTGELVVDPKASIARDHDRLVSIYYDWHVGGVPVEGAKVFARINSGNITQFGGRFVGEIDIDPRPQVRSGKALAALFEYSGDADTAVVEGDPVLLIQPEDGEGDRIAYRLVWKFRYTVPGEIETWEGRVDAHSGTVVAFRDVNMYNQVKGGIYLISPFSSSEMTVPMRTVDVFNGSNKTSDDGGEYAYSGGLTNSSLSGVFFDINCLGCNSPTQPLAQKLIGTGLLDFGMGGLNETGNGISSPPDRNTTFHLNEIRRLALKWVPEVGFLYTPRFTVNTNVALTCNATFNGSSMNFYRSGGGCNNSGLIADIINHEWGHGLDVNTQAGDGGTGEGTADVNAMHMSQRSAVGPGFGVTGGSVRNLHWPSSPTGLLTKARIDAGDCNTLPGNGLSVHCVGQVYGQAAWELATALTPPGNHHTGWRESERIFYLSLADAGSWDPADPLNIYDAYINADDPDGNLDNGTPHGDLIYTAFNTHGIATAPVGASPLCTRPDQPSVNATATCDTIELSWSTVGNAVRYEIFRAEHRVNTAYLPIGEVAAGTTTFTDEKVAPGVPYFYYVMAVDASDCESQIENPRSAEVVAQPFLDLVAYAIDDSEQGNGTGFPDPGETFDLDLTLANLGSAAANGISGTLTSSTPGVTILDDTAGFDDFDINDGGQNTDTLRVQLDDGLACGSLVALQFQPTEASTCHDAPSFFQFALGERIDGDFQCETVENCIAVPTFEGIQSAAPGGFCAESMLGWVDAEANCLTGAITYNVYRSTDPGFTPSAGNRVATEVPGTSYLDPAAVPGVTNYYIVRAVDSVSGEETNSVVLGVEPPTAPDPSPPVFAGIEAAQSGTGCGETTISWSPAIESCNTPVLYDIYRSTDIAFTPGPDTLVATTFDTQFLDPALDPSAEVTYVVRSRDGVGNSDTNVVKLSVDPFAIELQLLSESFESGPAGWALDPIGNATNGNWEHGDPFATQYQPGNDNTPAGTDCFITGLFTSPSSGDVDGGTTVLTSGTYDMTGAVDPIVRFHRWFTNDLGSAPGEATDRMRLEISNNDGATWRAVWSVGAGTELEWTPEEVEFGRFVAPTSQMKFRYQTADLGADSIVEAGVDDFELWDGAGGCLGCAMPVVPIDAIVVTESGDDVSIDLGAVPGAGERYLVYDLFDPTRAPIRLGSTTSGTFVHPGALLSSQSFFYRASAVDSCGNESALDDGAKSRIAP